MNFHFEGVMATFSVVDYIAAVKLKARSRKIVYPDNYRAIVLMRPLVGPPSPLAAELTEDDRRLIEEEAKLPQPPASTALPPTALPPTPQPPAHTSAAHPSASHTSADHLSRHSMPHRELLQGVIQSV
ncbi:uncharacterized protein LOC144947814 isoform X2 [Lampetra fluviatilis]